MTWITVATSHRTEWNKPAAQRAVDTERVNTLLTRLLTDLASLDGTVDPELDYLQPGALEAVRRDPDAFQGVGRLAADGGAHRLAATYWPDEEDEPVDVEVEVEGSGVPLLRSRRRLTATIDPVLDRIERLEIG